MTSTDEILFALDRSRYKLLRHVPDGMDYDTWKWRIRNAINDIIWYLNTGRADVAEIKTMRKCRSSALLKAIALSEDLSTNGTIAALKRYIDRAERRKRGR